MEKHEEDEGNSKDCNKSLWGHEIKRRQLKRQMSDKATYENRVARHFTFSVLKYDKFLSNNTMKQDG